MKYSGLATVGGLAVLLLGSAAAWRAGRSAVPEVAPRGVPAAPAPVAVSPGGARVAPAKVQTRTAVLTRQLIAPYLQNAPRAAGPQKELAASLQRDAALAADLLKDLLSKEPGAWREVLGELGAEPDVQAGIKAVGMIRGAVTSQTEPLFIETVSREVLVPARRAAVAVLAGRESVESLSALVQAAEADADPGVRHAALVALLARRDKSSENSRQLIAETFRHRAQSDADPEIREMARRVSKEAVPATSTASSPPPLLRRK